VNGVSCQQIGELLGRGQVVDRYELELGPADRNTQQYAADAAYSVESERDGHDGMRAVRREWNSISIACRRWQWGPPMLG